MGRSNCAAAGSVRGITLIYLSRAVTINVREREKKVNSNLNPGNRNESTLKLKIDFRRDGSSSGNLAGPWSVLFGISRVDDYTAPLMTN